jgi:hypothetical protein
MTDKLHAAVTRAAQAESLLRRDILQAAFRTLEADYIKAWAATEPAETAARENLWRAVQILGDVRRHLASAVTDGKIAQTEIDRLAGVNRVRA